MEDDTDSEIGARDDSFFDVQRRLITAFQDWRELGARPAVLRDFAASLRKNERRQLMLYLQIEESADFGLINQKFGAVTELDAFAAYQEARIGQVENREGWGLEVRYPFARQRGERVKEDRERSAVIEGIATMHKITIEQAQQYMRRSARDGLLPLQDWRLGLEGARRLPSIFFGSWDQKEWLAGGPELTEEARSLFEAAHPDYPGRWGQLRAQFMTHFGSEGATEGWIRGLAQGRGFTERERTILNDFRIEERDRVRLAMKEPLALRQQPGPSERVYLAAWYSHALMMVVRYSAGGIIHPNIHGALADIQTGRVHVLPEVHSLLREQRVKYCEAIEQDLATWGKSMILLRDEDDIDYAWPHEDGDTEDRRANRTWSVRMKKPEDEKKEEEERQGRRSEEARKDEEQQQAARNATVKAEAKQKGSEWERGKMPGKGGLADKNTGGKEEKKGDGKGAKKGDPKGQKGKDQAAKDDRGKLVTNVAASVVMPKGDDRAKGAQQYGQGQGEPEQPSEEEQGKAEAKWQRKPTQLPQDSQAQPDQWKSYYDRKQEQEDRGEWGTAAAGSQYSRWQERWNETYGNDQGGIGQGKYSQW